MLDMEKILLYLHAQQGHLLSRKNLLHFMLWLFCKNCCLLMAYFPSNVRSLWPIFSFQKDLFVPQTLICLTTTSR